MWCDQVDSDEREPWTEKECKEAGLQLQTLFYRAPEILFGDVGFGLAVDFWSLGIMMAELAGFAFSGTIKTPPIARLLT